MGKPTLLREVLATQFSVFNDMEVMMEGREFADALQTCFINLQKEIKGFKKRLPIIFIDHAHDIKLAINARFKAKTTVWFVARDERTFLRFMNVTTGEMKNILAGMKSSRMLGLDAQPPFGFQELRLDAVTEIFPELQIGEGMKICDAMYRRPEMRDWHEASMLIGQPWVNLLSAYLHISVSKEVDYQVKRFEENLYKIFFKANGKPDLLTPLKRLWALTLLEEASYTVPLDASFLRNHPRVFGSQRDSLSVQYQ